jgi:hypothetical protein
MHSLKPLSGIYDGFIYILHVLHCKKSFAKFRCRQRWREPNDVGVGKFLLPRRLVLRHRCQHRDLAHSDMAFLQCTVTFILCRSKIIFFRVMFDF